MTKTVKKPVMPQVGEVETEFQYELGYAYHEGMLLSSMSYEGPTYTYTREMGMEMTESQFKAFTERIEGKHTFMPVNSFSWY